MTYEGGNNDSEPRAGIKWVETHVQRLLEEMPSNKLILGIPFYGVDYIGKVIDGDPNNVDPLWKSDSSYVKNFYSSYISSALSNGYFERSGNKTYVNYWLDKGSWNEEYGITQYSFVDTEGYVHKIYVDDESSLYQKTDVVKKYQLAGVGVWREGFGSAEMWEALASGLSE
jgi:spore germination protein YaaH